MAEETDPGRFARIKELFGVATTLSGDERASYLEGACGSDATLRQEIEELLARDERAQDGFLSGTARAPTGPSGVRVSIPGFRLEEVLAAGASGLVHRAVQETPRREVAIKLLRLDTLGPGQVARFQREAEILARLAHSGIAQVFGAGVAGGDAGGLPWIAMELVRGRDLADWLKEKPDTRERVELFVELCEAVQHAHERGIVHRDLKPSNVLVTEGAHPKVIDFGIAQSDLGERATSERTRTGLVMGTLAYMAPEQARGERGAVGSASDVYALGVMLFEALTGALPLDLEATDVIEGARIVCSVEPRRLRDLAPELSRDLETILIKALDKDPDRRYACAGALGSDLANWLADRPVLARRPTIVYQTQKFVRRNRALTLGSALVIASLGLALLQLRGRLASERRGNERMSELTEVLSRKFFGLSERLGFSDQDRRDAEELIARIEEQSALDPEYRPLRMLMAQALDDLAGLHRARRAHVEAEACYRRALGLFDELAAEDPGDRESPSHASRLCAKLGEIARARGDLEERDRRFADALARDEALVARFPDELELREDLGWSLDRIAQAASERGDEATAKRLRLRRLADAQELVRLQPGNWKYEFNLSHVHYFLIGIDASSDHLEECLRLARRAVELRPGARDALIWLVQAERAARRHAPDLPSALEPGMAAYETALRIVREDPTRVEHLELLRLAGVDLLLVALRLGRPGLVQGVLDAIRERAEACASRRGLELRARLLEAELELYEAHLAVAEGRSEEARRLAARGWAGIHEVASADPGDPEDLALCCEIVTGVCFAVDPYPSGLVTSFFEAFAGPAERERARWFADELARADRLPSAALEELAELRRVRGF